MLSCSVLLLSRLPTEFDVATDVETPLEIAPPFGVTLPVFIHRELNRLADELTHGRLESVEAELRSKGGCMSGEVADPARITSIKWPRVSRRPRVV